MEKKIEFGLVSAKKLAKKLAVDKKTLLHWTWRNNVEGTIICAIKFFNPSEVEKIAFHFHEFRHKNSV